MTHGKWCRESWARCLHPACEEWIATGVSAWVLAQAHADSTGHRVELHDHRHRTVRPHQAPATQRHDTAAGQAR